MNEMETTETTRPNLAPSGVAPVVVAGVAAAALLAAKPARAATPALTYAEVPGTGDTKVLNFALMLERLETELYIQAVQRLSGGGSGGRDALPGTVVVPIGGVSNSTSPTGPGVDLAYYRAFTSIEQGHRDFLEGILTTNAIPVNAFKFDFGINNLNRRQLLDLVLAAEAIGVTAYLGALPFISDPATAQIAAAIQGIEARHTATLAVANNILVRNGTLGGSLVDTAPLANQNQGRDATRLPQQVLAIPTVQNAIIRV